MGALKNDTSTTRLPCYLDTPRISFYLFETVDKAKAHLNCRKNLQGGFENIFVGFKVLGLKLVDCHLMEVNVLSRTVRTDVDVNDPIRIQQSHEILTVLIKGQQPYHTLVFPVKTYSMSTVQLNDNGSSN